MCLLSWSISGEKAQLKNADNLPYLFQRFLDGESTKDELQLLFDHFNILDESELRTLIRYELENGSQSALPNESRENRLQVLYEGIANRIDVLPERKEPVRLWQFAAAIAAMLIIVTGFYWSYTNRQVKYETVYAAYGKRMEVQLPDSSEVWLNSGSTIQYPSKFSSANRTVILKDGEAFFQVVHDAHKPFIVHSGSIEVSVIGTSFEISAFEKEKAVKVTVATGKVGVLQPAINDPAHFLLPGQRAIINTVTHQIQTIKVDPADVAAWRNDRLIFEDEPIAEVLRTLERTYNIHISIENKNLLNERVSMRLNHQPLSNVLTAMSFANHFTFKQINEESVIVK